MFPRKIAMLFVTLVCATVSVPVLGQTEIPTGSRVGRPLAASPPNKPSLSDEDRALRVAFDYARCIVQHDEQTLRPLLSLEPEALTRKQEKALNRSACLRGGDLSMPMQIILGAVFRAFYLKDWGTRGHTTFGAPLNYYQYVDEDNEAEFAMATMLTFASCVVRADQTNTRTLVSGVPGEPDFENALQALLPQLGPCMPKGLNVTFSKSILVAHLARVLYWETEAAS